MPAKLPAAIVFVNVAGDAPALVAVTLTLIVQVAAPDVAGAAPSAPPLRSTLPPPGFAVSVPPHVVLAADGLATVIPAGNVSVSAMLPSAVALKLLIVRVSDAVPPDAIVVGENALATAAPVCTVTPPEIALFFTPCVLVTVLAASWFVRVAFTAVVGSGATT